MNDARRRELKKALDHLSKAREIVETAADEEQEYFDYMPENFQLGERGERAEEVAGELQDAFNQIEETIDIVERAVE
jgi:hypothetical protein